MRALIIVLDSAGIGGAPDAAEYGDDGANALGHIFEHAPNIRLPLFSLGLPELLKIERGGSSRRGSYARMRERRRQRHHYRGWELTGVILDQPFATFERFPDELVHAVEREAAVRFIGNCARSGTTILEELGTEQVRTGNPSLYTSADSVADRRARRGSAAGTAIQTFAASHRVTPIIFGLGV